MQNQREHAKQVICEIVAAAGGRLVGKVRLHKAFYYAHLYYWQRDAGVLTGYPVVRLPFGPAIDEGPTLVAELVREGKLRVSSQPNGPYKETVFELLQDDWPQSDLATKVACEALFQLAFDDEGRWTAILPSSSAS